MSMWLDLSVFFTTPISSNLPNSLRVSMSSEVRSSCTLMLSLCQFQDLTRLHHSEQFLATPSIQITPESVQSSDLEILLFSPTWFAGETESCETKLS